MKLKEITVYPDRNVNITPLAAHFNDAENKKAVNSLTLKEVQSNDSHELGLFDNDELVSYLFIEKRHFKYWQISLTQTLPTYQGQGCFRFLLLAAVKEHNEILSDEHQTEAAKKAWQSLMRYPGGKFQIFLFDTATGNTSPTYNVPDDQIWGDQPNPVLLITLRKLTEREQEIQEDRDSRLKDIERDYDSLFFGPASSNDNYTNP